MAFPELGDTQFSPLAEVQAPFVEWQINLHWPACAQFDIKHIPVMTAFPACFTATG